MSSARCIAWLPRPAASSCPSLAAGPLVGWRSRLEVEGNHRNHPGRGADGFCLLPSACSGLLGKTAKTTAVHVAG